MPSVSPKQQHLMAAVAHGWKPDRIKAPPVSVAKEFNEADKRKKMVALLRSQPTSPQDD